MFFAGRNFILPFFLFFTGCTGYLIIPRGQDVRAYKGEGSLKFSDDEEFSGDFIFLITREGNLRVDLVTFWGQTYAMISNYENKMLLFSPLEKIAYEIDSSNFSTPLVAIFKILRWILFNEVPHDGMVKIRRKDNEYFFSVEGLLEGKATIGENLNMVFQFENGNGRGELKISNMKPVSPPPCTFFKLSLPPGVKIEKLE